MSILFKSVLNTFSRSIENPVCPCQVRFRSQLAPKRIKYRKAHKGRIPVRTGGSIKGTTVVQGDYGLRVLEGVRLSAKQLQTMHDTVRKALKTVKGFKLYLRVFPDVPVCIKGNETRMGKGKGTFEYWACRVPIGKVLMEVGGGVRPEIAESALKLAGNKLSVPWEFITRDDAGQQGYVRLPPKSASEPNEEARTEASL